MKTKLKNIKMAEMLSQLDPLLGRRDKIGYVAARNYRILSNSLTEYTQFRNELIVKYGSEDLDKNGRKTGSVSLKTDSPNFSEFCRELEPFNNMEHEVELMTLPFEDAINALTGEELLSVDWMFEDCGEG